MSIPKPSTKHRVTPEEVGTIYRMTSLPPFGKPFVISPFRREAAIETVLNPEGHKRVRSNWPPLSAETWMATNYWESYRGGYPCPYNFPREKGREDLMEDELKDKSRRLYPLFAEILEYPNYSLYECFDECISLLLRWHNEAAKLLRKFESFLARVPLTQIQEICTRTFDLQPACYPYVG